MFSGSIATILAHAVVGPTAFAPLRDHLPAKIALGNIATAIPDTVLNRQIRDAGPTRSAIERLETQVRAAF